MKLLSNISTIVKLVTICFLVGFACGFCLAGTAALESPGRADADCAQAC